MNLYTFFQLAVNTFNLGQYEQLTPPKCDYTAFASARMLPHEAEWVSEDGQHVRIDNIQTGMRIIASDGAGKQARVTASVPTSLLRMFTHDLVKGLTGIDARIAHVHSLQARHIRTTGAVMISPHISVPLDYLCTEEDLEKITPDLLTRYLGLNPTAGAWRPYKPQQQADRRHSLEATWPRASSKSSQPVNNRQ